VNAAVETLRRMMDAYRDAGGRGDLALQVHLSWAPDEREAEALAYDQWRSNVFPPPVCWDVDLAATFDTISEEVPLERVKQVVNVSSDLGVHTAQLAEYAELGFDKIMLHHVGQEQEACDSALRQAALYRDGGHEWGVHLALTNAALHECGLGRFDSAIARLRSAIEALRRIGAPYGVSHARLILTCAHAMRGDREEALAHAQAAVPHLQRGLDAVALLLSVALVHARHGAEDRAAILLGYVEREFGRAGRIFFPMLARVRDEIRSRTRAVLEPAELARQTAAGDALNEEQAIAVALGTSPPPPRSDAPRSDL